MTSVFALAEPLYAPVAGASDGEKLNARLSMQPLRDGWICWSLVVLLVALDALCSDVEPENGHAAVEPGEEPLFDDFELELHAPEATTTMRAATAAAARVVRMSQRYSSVTVWWRSAIEGVPLEGDTARCVARNRRGPRCRVQQQLEVVVQHDDHGTAL
jgi:hypothetical protein